MTPDRILPVRRGETMRIRSVAALLSRTLVLLVIAAGSGSLSAEDAPVPGSYAALLNLFKDWRAFEKPPLRDGAPDYTAATLARKQTELKNYQARLVAIDPQA